MPQTTAMSRIRPPRICIRLKPAKNVRLVRAGAGGGEAGGAGWVESGCSAIAGSPCDRAGGMIPSRRRTMSAAERMRGHGEDGLERGHAPRWR